MSAKPIAACARPMVAEHLSTNLSAFALHQLAFDVDA
jgi:hypothetical protein